MQSYSQRSRILRKRCRSGRGIVISHLKSISCIIFFVATVKEFVIEPLAFFTVMVMVIAIDDNPFITFRYLPPNSRQPWPSAKPPGRSASQKKNSHARSPAVPLIGLEVKIEKQKIHIEHLKYNLSNLIMKPLSTSTSTHHTEWFCSKDCSTGCTARHIPSLGS